MNHSDLREQMVSLAYSMFMRGYSSGGAGNLSTRLPGGGYLVTPTNSSFGSLDASTLSELDENGNWISGDKPSKETVMHLAFYRQRPDIGGIVHLHSPSLTALSCVRPGHEGLADEVAKLAPAHNAMLLANHGPIIGGANLREATFNAEELEDTARLWFTLQPHGMVTLTKEQVHELQLTFGKKND